MNIYVCIKQVPAVSEAPIDQETGVLKRIGLESKMNPYDLFAVETALLLKETYGSKITAISMGPMQAEEILRECFYMGVDEAVLLNDRSFAGADVLSTAYTLSQGILTLGKFDVIICGKQTTDGDTAQVGPELAEFLDIPHITNVTGISKSLSDNDLDSIVVEEETESRIQSSRVLLPCLISVGKDINIPRLPSYKKMKKYENKRITVLGLKDLPDSNPGRYGIKGSPTQVLRIFPPEHNTDHKVFQGSSEEVSEKLYEILSAKKILTAQY